MREYNIFDSGPCYLGRTLWLQNTECGNAMRENCRAVMASLFSYELIENFQSTEYFIFLDCVCTEAVSDARGQDNVQDFRPNQLQAPKHILETI